MSNENRIYVASLSDYNAGILHGVWIDLDGKDADDIQEEVNTMLEASPTAKEEGTQAEEWAIHDYELPFSISEYESFEDIVERLELIEDLGEPWEAFVDAVGDHYAKPEDMEDCYIGQFDTYADFAEHLLDGSGDDIPEHLQWYFDYEKYGETVATNDCSVGHDSKGKMHIFWAH